MKLFKIIGLILVLSPVGQAFGVDQETLGRLHENDPSLRELYLSFNQIGDAGAHALAEALRTNTSLTRLVLGDNQIGPEGAVALAEALERNTSLTELNLFGNRIGNAGAVALAIALRTNPSLTTLFLSYNQIGDALMQEIERLMSPEGMQERRALVPWSRPRHLQLASWNPQVASVVTTILLLEVRSRTQYLSVIDAQGRTVRLPHLPIEMWHEFLGYLRCGAFGPLALPAP